MVVSRFCQSGALVLLSHESVLKGSFAGLYGPTVPTVGLIIPVDVAFIGGLVLLCARLAAYSNGNASPSPYAFSGAWKIRIAESVVDQLCWKPPCAVGVVF